MERGGRRQLAQAMDDYDGSRTSFATGVGMSIGQLRHIVSGRRKPTIRQAIAIEDEHGIPIRSWL
jgi:hypothetical protein